MQIVRYMFYRNIRIGISQNIVRCLGDVEIIIGFQRVIRGFGIFAEFCEDGIEPALEMIFICGSLFGIFDHLRDDRTDIIGS